VARVHHLLASFAGPLNVCRICGYVEGSDGGLGLNMVCKLRNGSLVFITALLMASSAYAGGFSIREQSTEGQGSSFAGVAAGTTGLSSMFWNPATMAQHSGNGLMSESNAALIIPHSEADDGGPAPGSPVPSLRDSGNIGVTSPVPASYWLYGINDQLVVGASLNAPLGLTTNADDWYGSPHGDKSSVRTYTFTPSVSYRVSDMISVGAGLQLEYMTVDINSRTPTGVEFFSADGSDFDVGFTAGILIEPTDTTDIGIGFRSSVHHKLKGDGFVAGLFDGDITAQFKSPEIVTLGLRQEVSDDLRLMAGVEWANWSRFEELAIRSAATGGLIGLTVEDWKDSWFYSVGGEYDLNDQITLRAGAAFEKSPVPDATRTPRVPDNDRLWLSLGASYQISQRMRANVAYSHIFVKDGDVNLAAAGVLPPLSANFEQSIDIISASLTMDW
jgi:long-chain fatty acid transport protein